MGSTLRAIAMIFLSKAMGTAFEGVSHKEEKMAQGGMTSFAQTATALEVA